MKMKLLECIIAPFYKVFSTVCEVLFGIYYAFSFLLIIIYAGLILLAPFVLGMMVVASLLKYLSS
jgi:hypothetical protein